MSTRANIIISDSHSHLWFYRHSDGYPEGVEETLGKFQEWLNKDSIRNNVSQSAGWLIMLGAIEYGSVPEFQKTKTEYSRGIIDSIVKSSERFSGWKVGAYEPTTGMHGDIDHLYVIDLSTKTVKEIQIPVDEKDWGSSPVIQEMKDGKFPVEA